MGGYRTDSAGGALTPVRDCLQLNEFLETSKKDSMQASRFDIPLGFVHNRFILAMGGKTSTQKSTMRCEAYDTVMDHWF